ncbi:MAG: acetyltransferase, partial [Muribaculaceae bacterium]|nr:acetyltransferase [Muribaculaceae bacterium]
MNIASKISYKLLGGFLKGLARLPFGVLYAISDFLYFLIYRVVRYRVKIARNNIGTSFPDKSEKECREIERKFYKHFADYIVETIKLLHITDDEMRKRMQYFDVSLVDESLSKGKSSAIY